MTARKLALFGVLALLGVAVLDSDAQAFGRKRNRGGSSSSDCECGYGSSYGGGYGSTYGGYGSTGQYGQYGTQGGVPLAMPVPAGGSTDTTRIPASGGVIVPASGTFPSESYYFDQRSGTYYPRNNGGYYGGYNGGYDNSSFLPGVMQGSSGSSYFPSTSPANYAGRRVGGLFRR